MLKRIQSFFSDIIQPEVEAEDGTAHAHGIRLATAALLVEMGQADFDLSDRERGLTEGLLTERFGLSPDEVRELVELGELEARDASSLFQFTRMIDQQLDIEEKSEVVTMLWEIAFADRRLDKYEESLVRKVSDLLHIPHKRMLQLKHAVMDRLEIPH